MGTADADGDGYEACQDCNDDPASGGAAINRGATELCDGIDNNCNGTVDEDSAIDAPSWYTDGDGDGYGDPASAQPACSQPDGYIADGTDCDDTDTTVLGPTTYWEDGDHDGYGDSGRSEGFCSDPGWDWSLTNDDCSGGLGWINPGAQEVCDGLDDNCDGLIDDDDPAIVGQPTWYTDGDGDGYGAGTGTTQCYAPDGEISIGGDCNDTDPAINPGATEVCDAALTDEDCDGYADDADPEGADGQTDWYQDADGDGYGVTATDLHACLQPAGYVAYGSDCDDANAAVNPSETEICSNLLDDDCNGSAGDCEISGKNLGDEVEYTGENSDDYAGWAVSVAGDVNGDGYDDVLVGAYQRTDTIYDQGAAYLVLGSPSPASASLSSAIVYTGEANSDDAGCSVSGAGDVNGDGYDDMLVGAYVWSTDLAGAAYLVLGSASPASASLSTAVDYTGENAGDYAGYTVAAAGDVNGDGLSDVLIGSNHNSDGGYRGGAAYLVLGNLDPASSSLSTAVEYDGDQDAEYASTGLAGAGDVDGDGLDDVLVGAPENTDGGFVAGAAYLIAGSGTPSSAALSTGIEWIGAPSDYAGNAVSGAGDVNGDGYVDLVVGAPYNNDGGSYAGAAYLVLGTATPASASLSTAIEYIGDASGERAGDSVAGVGDVDADGFDDVAIGAYRTSGGVDSVHLLLGSASPTDASLSTKMTFGAADPTTAVGLNVGPGGDVNGDGLSDFVVGSPVDASDAGAAYLVTGSGL